VLTNGYFTFGKVGRKAIDSQLFRDHLLNRTQSNSLLCVDYHFWFIRKETGWCILVIWHSHTWLVTGAERQTELMTRSYSLMVMC